MAWWVWLWIALSVLGAGSRVALVGQPRKPYTTADAVGAVVTLPLSIWFIVWIGEQCS